MGFGMWSCRGSISITSGSLSMAKTLDLGSNDGRQVLMSCW